MVRLTAGPLSRIVICRIGPLWALGSERWRSVTWDPVGERADLLPVERGLPRLSGELGLAPGAEQARLDLRAAYAPPGGSLGRLVDAAALHAVARRTAQDFLATVAAGLVGAEEQVPARG